MEDKTYDGFINSYGGNRLNTAKSEVENAGNPIKICADYDYTGFKNELLKYGDTTFWAGQNKLFQILVGNFIKAVDKENRGVDKYLEDVEKRRLDILDCMAQDEKAEELARLKYDEVYKNLEPHIRTETVKENGKEIKTEVDYTAEHQAKAAAAREKVWIEKRCRLWRM